MIVFGSARSFRQTGQDRAQWRKFQSASVVELGDGDRNVPLSRHIMARVGRTGGEPHMYRGDDLAEERGEMGGVME